MRNPAPYTRAVSKVYLKQQQNAHKHHNEAPCRSDTSHWPVHTYLPFLAVVSRSAESFQAFVKIHIPCVCERKHGLLGVATGVTASLGRP
jgi:hypothetical protein